MIAPAAGARPGPLQRIGYLLGRPLPDSMRDWVARDITGPGNARRYIVRGFVPFVPIVVGLCFIPAQWWVRGGMILLLAIPLLYFQIALKDVYRRHLLRNNGLDPKLASKVKIVRLSAADEAYRRMHRPEASSTPYQVPERRVVDAQVVDAQVVDEERRSDR